MPTTATPAEPDAPDRVEIVAEAAAWDDHDLAGIAGRAVAATLARLDLAPAAHTVVLLACDDARIASLNAAFRESAAATDVLSWPAVEAGPAPDGATPALAAEPPAELGDIALAYETCRRDAEALERPFADHLTHLVVHGCLHLLGFDHARDGDGALMRRLETETLATLALPDPYRGAAKIYFA